MSEELVLWHDFNVSLVTASAGLLGLLFVALSIHVRVLSTRQNAELRAVARTIFLGYVLALAIGFLALMPQTLSAFGRGSLPARDRSACSRWLRGSRSTAAHALGSCLRAPVSGAARHTGYVAADTQSSVAPAAAFASC